VSKRRDRVLLADDHPMMLEGLRKLLEPDYDVVGVVADGPALLEAAASLRPDLVIADISMPGIDGIEVTRRLLKVAPEVRVLILSLHTEPSWVRSAFEAGAHAYLPKSAAPEEIELAVREVLKGRFYVSPEVTRAAVVFAVKEPGRLLSMWRPPSDILLTPRELDIVRLVGKGLGNKEIAQELGVSVATVRTHLNRVYDKLGPGSRVELALYAAQGGGPVM
jgi:DNA-binding NarL/FixJ family response regulator